MFLSDFCWLRAKRTLLASDVGEQSSVQIRQGETCKPIEITDILSQKNQKIWASDDKCQTATLALACQNTRHFYKTGVLSTKCASACIFWLSEVLRHWPITQESCWGSEPRRVHFNILTVIFWRFRVTVLPCHRRDVKMKKKDSENNRTSTASFGGNLSSFIYHLSSIIYHLSSIIYHLSFILYHQSYII